MLCLVVLAAIMLVVAGCTATPDKTTLVSEESSAVTTIQPSDSTVGISKSEGLAAIQSTSTSAITTAPTKSNVTVTTAATVTEPDEPQTMQITVDGVEYTLHLYETKKTWQQEPGAFLKVLPFAVLTNYSHSLPPTLVMEGDTFLGFKATEIKAYYTCFEDGNIYQGYYLDAIYRLEGEMKIKFTIRYYINDYGEDALEFVNYPLFKEDYYNMLPHAWRMLAPQYGLDFDFKEIINIINNQYGIYEFDAIIKEITLFPSSDLQYNEIKLSDINLINVIEHIEE